MKTLLFKSLTTFIAVLLMCITTTVAQVIKHAPGLRLHRNFFPHASKSALNSSNVYTRPHTKNTLCIKSEKTYGGSGDEYFAYVLKLNDRNYLLYGNTQSGDGDFNINNGDDDAYFIKLNPTGNILWSKTYGGSGDDAFNQVVENANGDLIAAGYTSSNDGDVHGNHGLTDGWLVEVDANGSLKSQHCYGGTADDDFDGIVKERHGEFVIAGTVSSTDGDETGVNYHGGEADGWVLKVNKQGNIVWQKCIGGTDFEQLNSIVNINNKFYVSGDTWSFDGDAVKNHGTSGHIDQLLAKFKSNGDIVWTTCVGGSDDDICSLQSLVATNDRNLINVGTTGSNDGDVSGRTNIFDAWVPKINAKTGTLISQRCYGSKDRQQGLYAALPDDKGGFLLVGADASDFFIGESWNAMAIKIDAKGNEVWKTTFGGSDQDMVDGVVATDDGGFLLACYTRSDDGNITRQHGNGDVWMVKLGNCYNDYSGVSATGNTVIANNMNGKVLLSNYPNPFSNSTTISFSISQSTKVSINVFDLNGRLVKTLANVEMQAGIHQLVWNAKNEKGRDVAAGIYYLTFNAGNYSETRKLSVIK